MSVGGRGLAALAAKQHGVVSLAQLQALDLSSSAISRRVADGRLHRIHRGVYAVGHAAIRSEGRDLAAVLACGPGALLSHRSAGVHWLLVRYAPYHEVTVAGRRVDRPGILVRGTAELTDDDRALIDGIPVTSLARTIVDLADVLHEQRLADAVHEAEVQRILDVTKIERTLERLPGRRGASRLRRVLAAYGAGPQMTRNDAERAFLRLCADHAIPAPQANVLVGGYEVDFFWPEANLVLELDGGATHDTRRAFVEDRRRDRALAAIGIQVLRITWWDLADRPERVAQEVHQVLLARC